ncbi:hypothetical protein C3L33_13994, partial [Rhododendron williamsianum]
LARSVFTCRHPGVILLASLFAVVVDHYVVRGKDMSSSKITIKSKDETVCGSSRNNDAALFSSAAAFLLNPEYGTVVSPPLPWRLLRRLLQSWNACRVQPVAASEAGTNPLTPKASLIRYWKIQISNDLPKPWFLLNKASPLTAVESATFSKLANDQNALANQLQSFCSSADLLCFPGLFQNLEKHGNNVDRFMIKCQKVVFAPIDFVKIAIFQDEEMKRIFHAEENSSMASMLATAVSKCERAPIVGETQQCVGSVEDMIDFSISVLGHNVVVRTMENIEGSNKDVMIGKVSAINSGKVVGCGVLIEVVVCVLFLELSFVVCSCCSGVGLEVSGGGVGLDLLAVS